MIRVVHPGSGCWLSTLPGSRIQGSKRHRIPDPDPQHCVYSWFADLCSHELIPEKDKKEEGSPDTSEVDSNTDQVERRRSVRAKRDKVLHNYSFLFAVIQLTSLL
jgi:hypothetical protein